MNTTLTAASRHDHPPQQLQPTQRVRRVSPLDRLALRLGLALLIWARRPARVARTERYVSPRELAELQDARTSLYMLQSRIR